MHVFYHTKAAEHEKTTAKHQFFEERGDGRKSAKSALRACESMAKRAGIT